MMHPRAPNSTGVLAGKPFTRGAAAYLSKCLVFIFLHELLHLWITSLDKYVALLLSTSPGWLRELIHHDVCTSTWVVILQEYASAHSILLVWDLANSGFSLVLVSAQTVLSLAVLGNCIIVHENPRTSAAAGTSRVCVRALRAGLRRDVVGNSDMCSDLADTQHRHHVANKLLPVH